MAIAENSSVKNRTPDQAELYGEPLWPSDFGLKSIDIYTNTFCHGAGSEGDDRLCKYCYFPTSKLKDPSMMTLESLDQILTWATVDASPITGASLLGGELALHPMAGEIIKRVHGVGLSLHVVTSGSDEFRALLEKDSEVVDILQARRNSGYGRNLVAVSLDSIDEAANDKMRGEGALRKAVATIDALRELKIPFRINATVTKTTIDGMEKLYKFGADRDAQEILVHTPSDVGRGRSLVKPAKGTSEIPSSAEWNDKVLTVAEKWQILSLRNTRMGWIVCETGDSDYPDFSCEMLRRRSTLQFLLQSGELNSDIPVVVCGLNMENADTMSGCVLRDGLLRERAGVSELSRAREGWAKSNAECPLRPGLKLGCIHS